MSYQPLYNERELLLLVSEGNEKAFTEVFNFYRNKIYTVAYKLTHSQENAEEIVQDVFMKVWKKQSTLSEIENFDSWLFIITRNTVYSFLRSAPAKENHTSSLPIELSGIADGADAHLNEKELQAILNEAIDRLPPQQKQVYRLSKESSFRQDEISEKLGIAPETVKKHLQYAMRSIRVYMISRMAGMWWM